MDRGEQGRAGITYRGRFAPSPTGPLHFGSLIAAVGSYLAARSRGGQWLVRMEDLDPPREMAGAADDILRTLERFGFEWDGEIMYQSRRHGAYAAALESLRARDLAFPCACSRKELAMHARLGPAGFVYPGTCSAGLPAGRAPRAWRVRHLERTVTFEDRLHGRITRHLGRDIGDFIVRRADGFYAYQLAVVVDDASQGITHVVRGSDLIESTVPQLHLQQLLSLPHPDYTHLPVAVDRAGVKLSKQTHAPPLDPRDAPLTLWRALAFLGQAPPAELARADLGELWQWALERWREERIPKKAAIPAT